MSKSLSGMEERLTVKNSIDVNSYCRQGRGDRFAFDFSEGHDGRVCNASVRNLDIGRSGHHVGHVCMGTRTYDDIYGTERLDRQLEERDLVVPVRNVAFRRDGLPAHIYEDA